jgi:hypothetical protein
MTKWLGKWKATQQLYSMPRGEMTKISLSLHEMVKADMGAGVAKDWGAYAAAGEGYMIFEGSETQVYEAVLKYTPNISFEVVPIISLGQSNEVIKKQAAEAR